MPCGNFFIIPWYFELIYDKILQRFKGNKEEKAIENNNNSNNKATTYPITISSMQDEYL